MLKALELFFSHTKYSLTLLTTILAASMTVAAYSFDKLQGAPDKLRAVMCVAAIFLLLMGPVSYITYRLIGRYYRLYVSCYVYAVRLHDKYSSVEHPWFIDMKDRLRVSDEQLVNLDDPLIVSKFINDEVTNRTDGQSGAWLTDGGRNSWYFYRWLIFMLGTLGTIAGVVILAWIVTRS
jgi:hypothetical protein